MTTRVRMSPPRVWPWWIASVAVWLSAGSFRWLTEGLRNGSGVPGFALLVDLVYLVTVVTVVTVIWRSWGRSLKWLLAVACGSSIGVAIVSLVFHLLLNPRWVESPFAIAALAYSSGILGAMCVAAFRWWHQQKTLQGPGAFAFVACAVWIGSLSFVDAMIGNRLLTFLVDNGMTRMVAEVSSDVPMRDVGTAVALVIVAALELWHLPRGWRRTAWAAISGCGLALFSYRLGGRNFESTNIPATQVIVLLLAALIWSVYIGFTATRPDPDPEEPTAGARTFVAVLLLLLPAMMYGLMTSTAIYVMNFWSLGVLALLGIFLAELCTIIAAVIVLIETFRPGVSGIMRARMWSLVGVAAAICVHVHQFTKFS